MGAQKGGFRGVPRSDGERSGFIPRREPVSRFCFPGSNARSCHLADEGQHVALEFLIGGGPRGGHCRVDSSGGVFLAPHSGGKFCGAIACEEQVSMRINKTRYDGMSACVDVFIRCGGSG